MVGPIRELHHEARLVRRLNVGRRHFQMRMAREDAHVLERTPNPAGVARQRRDRITPAGMRTSTFVPTGFKDRLELLLNRVGRHRLTPSQDPSHLRKKQLPFQDRRRQV